MGLEAVAAPLVAAAGNVAGGAAASALMGDTSYPKGGGINGLTSANTGKSGISPAVQIDPTTALNYFQSAANSYQTNALTGLSYYNQAIQQASTQVAAGYTAANSTLQNISNSGTGAMNQYLKMLGLNAPSPTQYTATQVGALGSSYDALSQQIAQAENIQDPTQRAAAKTAILQGLQDTTSTQVATLQQQQKDALASLSANAPTAQSVIDNNPQLSQLYSLTGRGKQDPQSWLNEMNYMPAVAQANQQLTDYNNKVNQTNTDYTNQINSLQSNVQNISNSYNKDYTNNADYFGYTGQQANEQLAQTPGYQFSLQQGNEAIQRSAAAAGMLNSGNTLAAMDSYSQGLAQQTHNQYMSNLLGVSNQGTRATAQISQNQVNLGTALANLTQSSGQAGLNTYQGIGQALYNSYTNMGQTWNQDMLANMAAQNSMIQQSNSLSANTGIQAGYLNLANQKFANTLGQQYGYGSGVNGSSGTGGGAYYTAGGLTFPDYTGMGWGGN